MDEKQLKYLVALQDIDNMILDSSEEQDIGFDTTGMENAKQIRDEVAFKIDPPMLRTYERLHKRYRRAVVPVKDEICLGCFVKLPTSLSTRG
ncbi:MAG TPA: hypothetical protein ENH29_06990, partial [Bacteroidetes bacterium]|nr:hypothetical protein [Bacteroidota bacterium]